MSFVPRLTGFQEVKVQVEMLREHLEELETFQEDTFDPIHQKVQ